MTRDEAIEYIKAWLTDEYALNGSDRIVLEMAIEALSEPKTEWIPVSEALPSKGQVVLDIDDKETWGDKGTWNVDKQRGW